MTQKDNIQPTRFAELGYRKDGVSLWRIYDISGDRPATVGPHYRSKSELLADLRRFAQEFGCNAD